MDGNEPNLKCEFWRRIQLEIGLVPRLIKFILDEQELSATSWLGKLNSVAIGELQAAIDKMEPTDILPNPKGFKFTAIDQMCLDSIADLTEFNFKEEEMNFADSLNVRDPELEFVSAGGFAKPEPEEREEDMTFQDSLNVRDPELEYVSAGDFATPEPEEPDDDGAFEGSESYPETEAGLEDSEADDTIYEAEILFDNFKGELKLKNSTTKKHTYRIRVSNGKVHLILDSA